MSFRAFLVIILSAVVFQSNAVEAMTIQRHELPSYLQICRRNDPYLEECVRSSIHALRPYLKDGIPEMHIPKCEPLIIPEFIVTQGRGAIAMTSTYRDINIYGITEFEINRVKIDLDKNRFDVELSIPFLRCHSNYSMEGRMLILPIAGKGEAHANYTDIKAACTIQSSRFDKDGDSHWSVKDFFFDFDIGMAEIHVDGLFNDDKELGDTLNGFLNENWRAVAEEIKPNLEAKIGEIFKELANNIFYEHPISKLLPV